MRATRVKAAKHIHSQKKKAGALPPDDVFNVADVDMANIADGEVYYAGFTFRSALAMLCATRGLKTAYAGASHMDGKGSSTYGAFLRCTPARCPGAVSA